MNAAKMMEKLTRHSVVYENIGMQMQLGLPYFEKRNEKLCVSFLPHREDCRDGNMMFFAPQYKITWLYPFDRIIFFENSRYYGEDKAMEAVQTIPVERYAERGRFLLKALYEQCDNVLALYERDKAISDVTLRKYRKVYFETVQALGLTGVYGEDSPISNTKMLEGNSVR